MIPWFREVPSICETAAWRGKISVLKWAKRRGYPLDKRTWDAAFNEGRTEIMEYLRLNQCPGAAEFYKELAETT